MKYLKWILDLFKKNNDASVNKAEPVIVPPKTPLPEIPTPSDITNFEAALRYTFENEGTLSNDKFDKGGITKYGIILDDLKRIGRKNPSADEIRNLTKDDAKSIYKKLYWDALNLDEIINQGVAICMFDIGVVRGTGIPPKYCLEICGSNRASIINGFDSNLFIEEFSKRTASGFRQIVARNPTQARFINGWLNRANRLLTLIEKREAA